MRPINEIMEFNPALLDDPEERQVWQCICSLAEWLSAHGDVLARGRKIGFEVGLSKGLHDAVRRQLSEISDDTTAVNDVFMMLPGTMIDPFSHKAVPRLPTKEQLRAATKHGVSPELAKSVYMEMLAAVRSGEVPE